MFYEPAKGHGLPRDPYKAIVAPRPIGWISTLSTGGVANLAPYSFFNAIEDTPPMVMFASGGMKDSATNAIATGEFCVNMVSRDLADAMNVTSGTYPADIDEFALAGLAKGVSRVVKAPHVAAAPAVLECVVTTHFRPFDRQGRETTVLLVLGEVVGVHMRDDAMADGRFISTGLVARLGYAEYSSIDSVFSMRRP
jgi:flavin reductase (DIM6/NTAB) family NADH-FMN oxidoreductase RutF